MEVIERELFGKTISIETNKVAKQANGSVIVRCGDAVVLVTACMGDPRDVDFLPLTIDYVEKQYAAGKIPGGYFKREGRLSAHETLTSRLIDRPCRPMFPKGLNREIQIIATVLSADEETDTDVLALCGASTALTISDIPFDGPIAGVRVSRVKGELVINPSMSQRDKADLTFIVAGSKDAIVMVEGGADVVPEEEVLDALFFAHKEMQVIIEMQEELRSKVGKEKAEFEPITYDEQLVSSIAEFAEPKISEAVRILDKIERRDSLRAVKEEVKEKFLTEDLEDPGEVANAISKTIGDVTSDVMRGLAFDTGKRIDGRDFETVRQIDIEVGYLPRSHGSSLFTRGETQAIVTATLGLESEAQYLDPLIGDEDRKFFMLHYNFPPFSVGEARMMRGPGRREIGHGTLAERALACVLPERDDFPYVIRIVSEITESNGSSSMASVCGGSLALADAGVPIKDHVAGIAMGLLKEGDQCVVLTDILGDEDHLGDMDFKVCGTKDGVTALQMDIKIAGLDQEIMKRAVSQARDARLHILEKMIESLAQPREALNDRAPKISTLKIPADRVRDVIGPGGKMIRSIQEAHEVKVDIDDDGTVRVAGVDRKLLDCAVEMIKSLTAEPEVGMMYNGLVKRIAQFGAFVEILPNVDGLVHISEMGDGGHVKEVTDVMQEGDQVQVKCIGYDRQNNKIKLSHTEALKELSN